MASATRGVTMLVGAIMAFGVLGLSACTTSFPSAPSRVGEGYPDGGITTSVAWPSDWLAEFTGEPNSPPGPIVGLRLEYVEDQWVWRIRSLDPGRDIWGESVTEPERGQEALYDAATLALVQKHHVTLTDAELADVDAAAYDAAQLSGEVYPSPRLIELERVVKDGLATWRVTTYDTESGEQSVVTLDSQ